jgi:hypothetical protein
MITINKRMIKETTIETTNQKEIMKIRKKCMYKKLNKQSHNKKNNKMINKKKHKQIKNQTINIQV